MKSTLATLRSFADAGPARSRSQRAAAQPRSEQAAGQPRRRASAAQSQLSDAREPSTADAPAPTPDGAAEACDADPRRSVLSLPTRALLVSALPVLVVQALGIAVLVRLGTLSADLVLLVAAAGLAGAAPACLFAYASGRRVARRLSTIAAELQRVQEGDYRAQVRIDVADEIGIVAHRVNRLVAAAAAREKRLMENALVDPLTGLHNRILLTDRIRGAIATAQRAKGSFAVAVLDLDRFKIVNDTLGHSTGDRLLKEVARRLRETVRDSDTVARLGGDEFVLLMPGGPDAALEVSDRILQAMSRPLRVREQLIDIGLSIGIAMYPEHGQDDSTLIRHADNAMYRAKHQRLGRYLFEGDSRQLQPSHLSMLGEMRKALGESQFELNYQPQLSMRSGLIAGLEGLVRWRHPTRGVVPPNEFIPFAEQTGFMRELTQWVVAEGARFAAELERAGLDLRISVNVSAQDIEIESFCTNVGKMLAQHRVEPRRLCLEITESGVLSETETALRNLKQISALGVGLSVDDFGTGYASLAQLQRLPVQELKIDRSFVSGLPGNRGNQSIVRATIDMAKQLGLSVVAEGVETVNELRMLATMGCDEVQGYFLSKPMPASEVMAWVEARNALHAASRELYFEMLTGQ